MGRQTQSELLNGEVFTTLKEAQNLIAHWRDYFNCYRPHSSLGYRPPAPDAWLISPDPAKSNPLITKDQPDPSIGVTSVEQVVVYTDSGTANTILIRVDGYRYQNGKKLGNQAKAISISGDKVLLVVKVGTNTLNPTGGGLDIKPAKSFGGPRASKNGLMTLKNITVDGVSTNGAKLILCGDGVPIKTSR